MSSNRFFRTDSNVDTEKNLDSFKQILQINAIVSGLNVAISLRNAC